MKTISIDEFEDLITRDDWPWDDRSTIFEIKAV